MSNREWRLIDSDTAYASPCVRCVKDEERDAGPKSNLSLTRKCVRLTRENEKYRRKLAKRRATVMRKQWDPEFGFGEFASWYSMWRRLSLRARVPQMRLQMRMDFKKDRNRNPELLRFLRWQDAFIYTLGVESPVATKAGDK